MLTNKQVELELHLVFSVSADSEEEAKEDCGYFMQWVREQFVQWDESILQYFLYEYHLIQDGRYTLDLHIDKVIDNDAEDETISSKGAGGKPSDTKEGTEVNEMHEVDGDNFDDLMGEAHEDHIEDQEISPEPGVPRPGDTQKEVPNPMDQMKRLIKKKRDKHKEND